MKQHWKIATAVATGLVLVGCNLSEKALNDEEIQSALDKVIQDVYNMPVFNQKFPELTQWADDKGDCAVVYQAAELRVDYIYRGVGSRRYSREPVLQGTAVDCDDLITAYNAAVRTVSLRHVDKIESTASDEIKSMRSQSINRIANAIRNRERQVANVSLKF